jgi:predicted outer membrane protein
MPVASDGERVTSADSAFKFGTGIMRHTPLTGTFALSAALLVALACAVKAGEPAALVPTNPPIDTGTLPPETRAAAPEVHLNLIDQKLALSLAVDTQWQIEMAEFALKSIANDALRRLVTVRLEGQRDFAAQLNTLTGGRAESTLAQARREIEKDRAPDNVPDKTFRLLSIRSATAMLARIRVEILQEYAAMQRDELAAKSTDKFDLHYLRYDLLNQMQVLSTLQVFEHQASADFAQVIHRTWARAHEQFELANQLLVQLETAPLAGVAPARPDPAGVAPAQPKLVETVAEP